MWSCMSERASAYLHGGRVLSVSVAVTTCLLGERGNRREALRIPTSLLSDFSYASGTLARLCPRATGAQVFAACTCALVHVEGLSKAPDEHWPGISRSTPVPFKPKLVVMDLDSGIHNKRLRSGVHYNLVHQTKVKRPRRGIEERKRDSWDRVQLKSTVALHHSVRRADLHHMLAWAITKANLSNTWEHGTVPERCEGRRPAVHWLHS